MMRLVLVTVLSLAALVCGVPLQSGETEASVWGYHTLVGIKQAELIRKAEEELFQKVPESPVEVVEGELQNGRIVGGAVAPVNAHPYLAGLIIDLVGVAGNSVCGGSLVTANRVLTAAHCWFDGRNQAWRFTVVLGSQYLFLGGGTRIPTSTVVLHPQWTPSTIAQDVAMIYLPYSIAFTSDIHPVSLPTGNTVIQDFTGQRVTAAGYGRTSDQFGLTTSTLVSHVGLQVISNQQCQMTYGSAQVLNSNICTSGAGGVGICGGDSGGPLLAIANQQITLIGVSSFVARDGCQLGHPSVFARVTSFLNFIYQHL